METWSQHHELNTLADRIAGLVKEAFPDRCTCAPKGSHHNLTHNPYQRVCDREPHKVSYLAVLLRHERRVVQLSEQSWITDVVYMAGFAP